MPNKPINPITQNTQNAPTITTPAAPDPLLRSIALSTPDPDRAENSLAALKRERPEEFERLGQNDLYRAGMLFAYSQFLANYSIQNPAALIEALALIDRPVDAASLAPEADALLPLDPLDPAGVSAALRDFKKRLLLRITLRDVLKTVDPVEGMKELSALADLLIGRALAYSRLAVIEKHGKPSGEAISLIALGKLGAGELNYSSDVDLICIHSDVPGDTSGTLSPHGSRLNRISAHEYYCKLVEGASRLISQNTPDGYVYRVDLRLRPDGQRGELSLPLQAVEVYYESWGREWERLALVRARHVAGSPALGADFINMIRPFVYRKYIDLRSIEEIGGLKKKIDAKFGENDIKRGYGGIREAEFFVQALQIVYGGKEPLLQERSLLIALHRLRQKNLVGTDDYAVLGAEYLFLRRLEHVLQMLNDLQTHTVSGDLDVLARKMGFPAGKAEFTDRLTETRHGVRRIYDSLFHRPAGEPARPENSLFDPETGDEELLARLALRGFGPDGRILHYIKTIRGAMNSFKTLRSRRLQEEIIPVFAEKALSLKNPETALKNLLKFVEILTINTAYLEIFKGQDDLMDALVGVFSQSDHLSSIIMGNMRYMEVFAGGTPVKKTLSMMRRELASALRPGVSTAEALCIHRKMEELRLGLMFLNGKKPAAEFMRALTMTAESALQCALDALLPEETPEAPPSGKPEEIRGMTTVGLGKFGGREITVGSDLDVMFVSASEPGRDQIKAAERLMRAMMSYTREGTAYLVDARLRPDGSKGPLVISLSGFSRYYLEKAHPWEVQALLKARPVTGEAALRAEFMRAAGEVISRRGAEVTAEDVRAMRERIKKERAGASLVTARDTDVKLDDGGIEDIDFLIQYLQLKNAARHPALLVQGTTRAISRLTALGLLEAGAGRELSQNYYFLRTVETLFRLRADGGVGGRAGELEPPAAFFGQAGGAEFLSHLKATMARARSIVDALLR
jgi:glutamate-ammonia-ligase adenylyltransferase